MYCTAATGGVTSFKYLGHFRELLFEVLDTRPHTFLSDHYKSSIVCDRRASWNVKLHSQWNVLCVIDCLRKAYRYNVECRLVCPFNAESQEIAAMLALSSSQVTTLIYYVHPTPLPLFFGHLLRNCHFFPLPLPSFPVTPGPCYPINPCGSGMCRFDPFAVPVTHYCSCLPGFAAVTDSQGQQTCALSEWTSTGPFMGGDGGTDCRRSILSSPSLTHPLHTYRHS